MSAFTDALQGLEGVVRWASVCSTAPERSQKHPQKHPPVKSCTTPWPLPPMHSLYKGTSLHSHEHMRPQHLGCKADTNSQQQAPIAPFVAVADASAGHLEKTETFLVEQFLQAQSRICWQPQQQLRQGTKPEVAHARQQMCQCSGPTCFWHSSAFAQHILRSLTKSTSRPSIQVPTVMSCKRNTCTIYTGPLCSLFHTTAAKKATSGENVHRSSTSLA